MLISNTLRDPFEMRLLAFYKMFWRNRLNKTDVRSLLWTDNALRVNIWFDSRMSFVRE